MATVGSEKISNQKTLTSEDEEQLLSLHKFSNIFNIRKLFKKSLNTLKQRIDFTLCAFLVKFKQNSRISIALLNLYINLPATYLIVNFEQIT